LFARAQDGRALLGVEKHRVTMAPKKAPEPPPEEEPSEEPEDPGPLRVRGLIVPESWIKDLRDVAEDPESNAVWLKTWNSKVESDKTYKVLESTAQGFREDADTAFTALDQAQMIKQGRREGTEASERRARRVASESRGRASLQQKSFGSTSPGADPASPMLPQQPMRVAEDMQALARNTLKASSSSSALVDHSALFGETLRKSSSRLLLDMELARSDMLVDVTPHLRHGHLGRSKSFLESYSSKEQGHRQQSPSFVKFTKDDQTMTGSLRVEPHERLYAPEVRPPKWQWAKATKFDEPRQPTQRPGWMHRSLKSAYGQED